MDRRIPVDWGVDFKVHFEFLNEIPLKLRGLSGRIVAQCHLWAGGGVVTARRRPVDTLRVEFGAAEV